MKCNGDQNLAHKPFLQILQHLHVGGMDFFPPSVFSVFHQNYFNSYGAEPFSLEIVVYRRERLTEKQLTMDFKIPTLRCEECGQVHYCGSTETVALLTMSVCKIAEAFTLLFPKMA